MSNTEDVKFSLRVMINKQKTKVIYAEADSDFTDVVLSFLTLPLGTIVRILKKNYGGEAPVVGSLTTLYNSLSNLDSDHFFTKSGKSMPLNPRKSFINKCGKLKLNIDDTPPTKCFECADISCSSKKIRNMGLYYDTSKCDCGKSALSVDCGVIAYENTEDEDNGECGLYTKSAASFLITDDLKLFPSETGYAIRILTSLGITCTDGTELKDVTFGFNEVMDLLKGSLLSHTPLTDLILNKGSLNSVTVKCDTCFLPANQTDKQSSSNDKKMAVKAIIQGSTNRLLLIEADGDFVDFLFTLFTIPLGAVECLLGGSTTLKNIDNLYRSFENINDDKYIKTQDTEEMLLEPEIPTGYVSKNKILPLIEESLDFCFCGVSVSSVKSPKGPGNYVKGQKKYMVTDDLTVTPFYTASSISIINRLKVPLSDIKELELDIGLNEALSILKASLTSTSALSDGLKIKPSMLSGKKLKQEHQ